MYKFVNECFDGCKLIEEQKTKDSSAKEFYDEKINAIDEQIKKTVNTGRPYAHEIDEVSGGKYKTVEPNEISKPKELNTNDTSGEINKSVQPDITTTKEQGTESGTQHL